MVFFENCKTVEEAKKLYKKLAFENHPDRGGSNDIMQQINSEYSFFVAKYAKGTTEQVNEEFNLAQKFVDIINKLAGLEGIVVELIGDWLWISGNTYIYREQLKKFGCFFAPKKKLWYYRDEKDKSYSGKPQSMFDIRLKYGSREIKLEHAEKLKN